VDIYCNIINRVVEKEGTTFCRFMKSVAKKNSLIFMLFGPYPGRRTNTECVFLNEVVNVVRWRHIE